MANWLIKQVVDLRNEPRKAITAPYELMFPGDAKAHVWEIDLYLNGEAVDLTGSSVAAYFLRRDGNTVMVQGTVSGNTVRVEFAQACYAISGAMQAGIRVTKGGEITTVAYRIFNVLPTYDSDSYIDPGQVIPSIADLLAAIDRMETATAAAESAASHSVVYDSTQSLTDTQKSTARGNIDAVSEGELSDLKSALESIGLTVVNGQLYIQPVESIA